MVQKVLLAFLFGVLVQVSAVAQIDTEFWFAAPEVSQSHDDRPIYLRISTYSKSSKITIIQPANPSFAPISQIIAANTTLSIDLTSQIDIIENKPSNTILDYGLYLSATNPITAYYEVLGTTGGNLVYNSDIFALKGNHALGKEFYTPFQTHWDNYTGVNAISSFDIVATENNTQVTITPTQNLVGHAAGISYTITLQKGQTYSAEALSPLAANHPTGSHITSNKPIAVTVKDDSMFEGGSYDLAGDQIIPVNYIGKEYIAIKISDTAYNMDRVYIVATKPSTSLYLDGSGTASAVLNAGEAYEIHLTNPSVYITASDSVYVWQISGFGNELGGAIIPPLGCTGSRQVNFTRSNDEEFYLEIIVKSGYEKYFKLNNSSTLVSASMFTSVTGSAGVWKYAKIPFTSDIVPTFATSILRNDSSDFQMALFNGSYTTGFRFGYFSDFGFLELGSNKSICEGDSIRLNAGPLRDSYLWNTGANSQYITVQDSGVYRVTITKGVCTIRDSVKISFHPKILTDVLGNDTSTCRNVPITISTLYPYASYAWSNGARTRATIPTNSGNYIITVKNSFGCKKSDTMNVTLYPVPNPTILYNSDEESFCKNPLVQLQANNNFPQYLWSTGDTTKAITTMHTPDDSYSLLVKNSFGCVNSTTLKVDCTPIIGMIPNLITPNGDSLNDRFYVEYLKPNSWTFEVFNRWGDRIYRNISYDNSFDGHGIVDGLYYFSLRHNEGKGEKKGWLQITR